MIDIDIFLCCGTDKVFYIARPSTGFLTLGNVHSVANMVMQVFCNTVYSAVTFQVQATNDVFIWHLLHA